MAKQERAGNSGGRAPRKGGGAPSKGAAKGAPKGPSGGWRPGKSAKSGDMKAGMFAKMRANIDAVAFAKPGVPPISARLFVENVEALQKAKRGPRHFVLIVASGLEAEVFEVYQVAFTLIAPLLKLAAMSSGGRAYWTLAFDKPNRTVFVGDSTRVELRRLEKRRD